MTDQNVKSRLTAILSADVQGYSRLMGEDEVGTVQRRTRFRELMVYLISGHEGRVVDSPGDNLLAEFMHRCEPRVLSLCCRTFCIIVSELGRCPKISVYLNVPRDAELVFRLFLGVIDSGDPAFVYFERFFRLAFHIVDKFECVPTHTDQVLVLQLMPCHRLVIHERAVGAA